MEREAREAEDEEVSADDSVCNEGIIFYNDVCSTVLQFASWLTSVYNVNQSNLFITSPEQNIQPVDSEYREKRDYVLTKFIKEGCYGAVYSAEDVNTGFKFAVKKVTQSKSDPLFAPLTCDIDVLSWLIVFFNRWLCRGSSVRRWVRGVPLNLPVWWNSSEWSERGLTLSFWWNRNLVNTVKSVWTYCHHLVRAQGLKSL